MHNASFYFKLNIYLICFVDALEAPNFGFFLSYFAGYNSFPEWKSNFNLVGCLSHKQMGVGDNRGVFTNPPNIWDESFCGNKERFFAKTSMLDVWQGSKYASASTLKPARIMLHVWNMYETLRNMYFDTKEDKYIWFHKNIYISVKSVINWLLQAFTHAKISNFKTAEKSTCIQNNGKQAQLKIS